MGEPYSLSDVMPTESPRRSRWVVPVIVSLVVLLMAVSGVAAWALKRNDAAPSTPTASTTPPTVLVAGSLVLADTRLSWRALGDPCDGDGGYSDIHLGAQVIVSDPNGQTVAIGALSLGQVTKPLLECRFTFSVYAPAGLGFYGISIGSRRPYQVAEKDLAPSVDLTLGG